MKMKNSVVYVSIIVLTATAIGIICLLATNARRRNSPDAATSKGDVWVATHPQCGYCDRLKALVADNNLQCNILDCSLNASHDMCRGSYPTTYLPGRDPIVGCPRDEAEQSTYIAAVRACTE